MAEKGSLESFISSALDAKTECYPGFKPHSESELADIYSGKGAKPVTIERFFVYGTHNIGEFFGNIAEIAKVFMRKRGYRPKVSRGYCPEFTDGNGSTICCWAEEDKAKGRYTFEIKKK